MTEGEPLSCVQVTDFSDVLVIISFHGLPSSALVRMKKPHLSIPGSQANDNCQCLFIKRRSCQTSLFYIFFDAVLNQHSVSEGSRRYHVFDFGKFLTVPTPTFFWVKIDRSSVLNWQKIEGIDAVGAHLFLVKHVGYDLCEQRIHLKTAEYINMGTGWGRFREHNQN